MRLNGKCKYSKIIKYFQLIKIYDFIFYQAGSHRLNLTGKFGRILDIVLDSLPQQGLHQDQIEVNSLTKLLSFTFILFTGSSRYFWSVVSVTTWTTMIWIYTVKTWRTTWGTSPDGRCSRCWQCHHLHLMRILRLTMWLSVKSWNSCILMSR